MRKVYLWQQEEWPLFVWDESHIGQLLAGVRHRQGLLVGRITALGFEVKGRTMLEAMTADVIRSSEIEGVALNAASVRSSVARHLGLEIEGLTMSDHYTEGLVQVMMDAVQNHAAPLTSERLFNWHAALFPTGRSGVYPITVADWRQGIAPMQVISGPVGKERVHFEAPPSEAVPNMMDAFLDWFNGNETLDPVLKAAVAHLWFVTIHPFDDGNGRLTRTITDLLLARADALPHRFYSMSAEIARQRNTYYEQLERAQRGDLDITAWLSWFLSALDKAVAATEATIQRVLDKADFWERNRHQTFNPRQQRILNLLFDGFEGKLTSSKWAKINKCSSDTALRDIQDLMAKDILRRTDEGGRSVNYELR